MFSHLSIHFSAMNLFLQIEGPQLMKHGFSDAITKVGMTKFISDLFWVGMFYHLYNQVLNVNYDNFLLHNNLSLVIGVSII